ncbi:MAG: DUF6069 family protein [Candidatus Nanopelagicales bacterium]
MSAPWADSVTPVPPPASSVPHTSNLVYAGVVTGAWSGLLSLTIYGLGRLLGVPFEVMSPGSESLQVVPWFLMLLVPLLAALVGALLAALMLGRRHARRIVFWAGTGIAVLTCAIPLVQPDDVLWSTRIWLLIPHVITWFLVVPQIARIVGDSEPGMFAPSD